MSIYKRVIQVKILITLVLLFISSLSLQAEKKIDITPIKLPYDSLMLKDIYAFNSTILVRSGSKIYKSSDNGINWKIAFDSKKKINQLYSQDPHTIFIVGDSGLVYRTFDYGDSWINISHNTNQNLLRMAAKDYENYMVITGNRAYINNINSLHGALIPLNYISDIPLYNIIFSNDKYYFHGSRKKEEYYDYYRVERVNIFFPYNIYDGEKLTQLNSLVVRTLKVNPDTETDSLWLFPSKYGIYHTKVLNHDNSSDAVLCPGPRNEDYYDDSSIEFNKDNIKFVDEYLENTTFFTRQGFWVTVRTDTLLKPAHRPYTRLEHQDLNIKPINSAFRTDSNSFYIASNNSTIYRVDISGGLSSVETDTSSPILLDGNILSFDNRVDILSIYNYMGVPVNYTNITESRYRIPNGLNFVTYMMKGTVSTLKVLVIE